MRFNKSEEFEYPVYGESEADRPSSFSMSGNHTRKGKSSAVFCVDHQNRLGKPKKSQEWVAKSGLKGIVQILKDNLFSKE